MTTQKNKRKNKYINAQEKVYGKWLNYGYR